MSPLKAIAAAAVVLAAAQAHAISFTVTTGASSKLDPSLDGVVTDTFDMGLGDISLNPSGGTFYSGDTISGVSAKPPGSTGQWWSIAGTTESPGVGTVSLNVPATYYGFLWGSPDQYNSVSIHFSNVFSGVSGVTTYTGGQVLPPADGDQGARSGGQYVNFFADEGESITKVEFISAGIAFETDNHSVVFQQPIFEGQGLAAAVPEPETYALMLAGLCAIGFMSRNRRSN